MSATAGDILRGMEVERVPLAVGRPRRVIADVQKAKAELAPQLEPAAVEALRREAQRAGYEEGRRQGLEDAKREAAAATERAIADALAPLRKQQEHLSAVSTSLAEAMEACLAAAEDDIVAVCFETVCRLVTVSALQPDAVRATVRSEIGRVAEGASVAIHVHPQDAELLRSAEADARMRYVSDPQVALGGCIVRQPGGGIDARLETTLAACKEALLAARAKAALEVCQ